MYAGALIAALTYSGSAAIHASLMVWRGSAYGELDVFPLFAILSTSCIIAVPLINWSKTLRRVGAKDDGGTDGETEKDVEDGATIEQEDEFNAGARAIIIFWAFLVGVGFLSIFVALKDDNVGWSPYTWVGVQEITCTPENQWLNTNAGQLDNWDVFVFTDEFVTQNGCSDPCAEPYDRRPLFRRNESPILLGNKTIDEWVAGIITDRTDRRRSQFASRYLVSRDMGSFGRTAHTG